MTDLQQFKYDVFLSHSAKDKPVMRELAERLKGDGLRVWFKEWELSVAEDGSPPQEISGTHQSSAMAKKIEEGLVSSRVLVLAMSQHAFESEWATLESSTYRFRDSTNRERRFIPLRLDNTEIKEPLKQFAYVDWRERAEDGYSRLLAICRQTIKELRDREAERIPVSQSQLVSGANSVSLAITPDCRLVVGGCVDGTVKVWNLETVQQIAKFEGHNQIVLGVAVAKDGLRAVSVSGDKKVLVWNLAERHLMARLTGHTGPVTCVKLTHDGRYALSGSQDSTLRLWDLEEVREVTQLEGHTDRVFAIAVTEDARLVVSGSHDSTLIVWNLTERRRVSVLHGHLEAVTGVTVIANGRRAVSSSWDKTVRVWDLENARLLATLEGHTDRVLSIAATPDGKLAVSGSKDKTIRLWDIEQIRPLLSMQGHEGPVSEVAITPDGKKVVSTSGDGTIRVWHLPSLDGFQIPIGSAAQYTNAKVILTGDSGTGKSGIAYRLSEDRFVPTISTDAVWATQLKLLPGMVPDGLDREVWLWDFAGQADYRLIHQLYMDETALAVLVFNPQSENPFEGLGQWDRDLQRAARRRFKKLLVAGRCDRGGLMVSRESIERFRQERGFTEYIETSALRGTGCDKLRDAIICHIPWDEIPWTTSPRIFRLLKDKIVELKDEGKVLLRMAELKQQLELRLPEEIYTLEQLRAVVGLLAGPGVVWQLEFGDFVLLHPERVNAYAAAVIRSVRAHTEEIGCIPEEDVLAGRLDYQDIKRLPPEEEQIVLRAMHQTFVDHGLCLREHTDKGTLLIFPSYFKRERPDLEGHPLVVVTYEFNGPLDEVYATLVVRLHHTATFRRDQLWRFAADFKTETDKRLGLRLTKKAEGAAELEVYFEAGISDDMKVTFIRYVHEHLKLKGQNVNRRRHYVCPHCQTPVEGRKAIEKRLAEGFKDMFCSACGKQVVLWDLIEEKFASEEFQRWARELDERAKTAIDNESRELILVGHAYAIAGEAGQIYRQYTNSDHGIDGEIEFKDVEGKASGRRLYLQLKSGNSYLTKRKRDDAEIFEIKNPRHADYWRKQAYPVMLAIRSSDGVIRWMDVGAYLREQEKTQGEPIRRIVFKGESFTALNLRRMRDKCLRKSA